MKPDDFMFQLIDEEVEFLVSQNVIPSRKVLGGALPYAFTQEGVAMLSSVLRSKQAVQINIAIIRTFIRMREMLATHADVARKIEEHDQHIAILYDYIKKLMEPPESSKTWCPMSKKPIGYIYPEEHE